MKTVFIRNCMGLQLVVTPESNTDRAFFNELIGDHYARFGKPPALRVDFEKEGCNITQIGIRQKVYLNNGVLLQKGFLRPFEVFGSRCGVFFKRIGSYSYLLFGTGVYRVLRLDGIAQVDRVGFNIEGKQVFVNSEFNGFSYKKAPTVQTLDELEKLLNGMRSRSAGT